jgi:hypothetical protein
MKVFLFLVVTFALTRAAAGEDEDDFDQSGEHIPCWPTAAQLIKVKTKI